MILRKPIQYSIGVPLYAPFKEELSKSFHIGFLVSTITML
jgi:hypothetical protein